jgi:hypothetical protein
MPLKFRGLLIFLSGRWRWCRGRCVACASGRHRGRYVSLWHLGSASQDRFNDCRNQPILREKQTSATVACGYHKEDENGDDSGCDQHPILRLDTKNRELISQKLHVPHPLSCATYAFCRIKYIIFISSIWRGVMWARSPLIGVARYPKWRGVQWPRAGRHRASRLRACWSVFERSAHRFA